MIHAAPPEVWAVAFARACAFSATAPLAGSGGVPKALRVVLALALTPAVLPHVLAGDSWQLAALENALIGCSFGIAAAAVAAAGAGAGSLVDGVLASKVIDREAVFGGDGGPFARLFALAFAGVFLASGAMTNMCERFTSASSDVLLVPTLHGAASLARASFSAALALAAPALVAQCLGTVIAAAAARAAPRINGLMLSSPVVAVLLLMSMLAAAPSTLTHLIALARAAASWTPL